MIWRLRYTKESERQLKRLPEDDARTLAEEIDGLQEDPHPLGSIRLHGTHADYRLRIDPYRILYRVKRDRIIITRVEKRTGRTYRGYNPDFV